MEHEQTGPDDEKRSTTSTPNDNEGASKNEDDVRRQDEAAKHIQRVWKQRKKTFMNTDVRWDDAATHTKMKIDRDGQDQGKNDPRARWKRAKFLASRLQDGNQMLSGVGVHDDGAVKKSLETQHWLEMVDAKHRYGSNLKWYHRVWQTEDTEDNFFRWLDKGDGKALSLPECPRERLEEERIAYLSAEQRLNYLVKIDEQGKLRWAKNNDYIDTTSGHWKDAGPDIGIVPQEVPDKDPKPRRGSFDSASVTPSSLSSSDDMAATHYVEATRGRNRLTRALKTHLTLRGIMDKLLRKTVQRNTWIYVTDKQFNMFIGIKSTGAFQHSSFLSGGIVTSAGLISVKKGTLYTISPLSGHYRTTISHFRKFVEIMKERGVDMHKAKVSKAEAALWGIEHIGKAQKAKSSAIKSTKEGVKDAVHKVTDVSWKRDVLEGRRKKDEKAAQDEGKDVSGEPSDDKRPQPNGTHDAGEKPAADVTGSDKEGHPDGGASDAVASE